MPSRPRKRLETFPNPEPGRDYLIRHECPEYTALCPVTGQPDFGTIIILYTPDRLCVELKSLKLYLWSFRNEGHYFEQVTNRILDDLVGAVQPRRMTVIGEFNVRGGIASRVVARYERESGEVPTGAPVRKRSPVATGQPRKGPQGAARRSRPSE